MEGKSFLLKIKVSLKPKQMETLPALINVFCFLFPLIEPPLSDYQELITILNSTYHCKVNFYYESLHYEKQLRISPFSNH